MHQIFYWKLWIIKKVEVEGKESLRVTAMSYIFFYYLFIFCFDLFCFFHKYSLDEIICTNLLSLRKNRWSPSGCGSFSPSFHHCSLRLFTYPVNIPTENPLKVNNERPMLVVSVSDTHCQCFNCKRLMNICFARYW